MGDLPLCRHTSGQWCKKINGKFYYFGTDLEKALLSYSKSKENLRAGLGKIDDSPDLPLHELADLYYDHKKQQVAIGEFSDRSLQEVKKTLVRLCGVMGRTSDPASWNQDAYQRIKVKLLEPVSRKKGTGGRGAVQKRSHVTVNGDIRRIKAFLNWLRNSKYLPPAEPGCALSEFSSRITRLERHQSSSGPLPASHIRSILSKCNVYFLPVVYLGINGGMGVGDISRITLDQLEDLPWLNCPRNKTGTPRRIYLWPETIKAIKASISRRKESSHLSAALLTSHGTPWQHDSQDAGTQMFRKARIAAKLKKGSFYDLRRTFQTVGDETMDFPAVSFCMGHTPSASDMSSRYRQVSDERIKKVCLHIRSWLLKTP
jgi:integrase